MKKNKPALTECPIRIRRAKRISPLRKQMDKAIGQLVNHHEDKTYVELFVQIGRRLIGIVVSPLSLFNEGKFRRVFQVKIAVPRIVHGTIFQAKSVQRVFNIEVYRTLAGESVLA